MANDLIAASTPEKKLSWAFRVSVHYYWITGPCTVFFVRYDLDNSGAIDKEEMVNVMQVKLQ